MTTVAGPGTPGGRPRAQSQHLSKMERLVVSVQDPDQGVRTRSQRLLITVIPHAVTGGDIVEWLAQKFCVSEEAEGWAAPELRGSGAGPRRGQAFISSAHRSPATWAISWRSLALRPDETPYRSQTPYFWTSTLWPVAELDYAIYLTKKNIRKQGALMDHEKEHYDQLHKKINHMWNLVVMQAREQLRVAKQRRKVDRLVTVCQEQTYWLVNRPPGSRALTSISGRYLKFSNQHSPHDPIMSECLPSNPWITDDDTYWAMNAPIVAVPTKLRVERWGFSFRELLDDPVGRAHFMDFLQKEFSGWAANLVLVPTGKSQLLACEELRFGGQAQVLALVDAVYQQFLAPGAARWVNIDSRTMELTLEGLPQPHCYVLDMHSYTSTCS